MGSNEKIILIGGISGSLSTIVNHPFDVIKSKIQAEEKRKIKFLECFKDTIKKYGFAGLFSGINARFIRVGLAQAVTFLVYENSLNFLKKF